MGVRHVILWACALLTGCEATQLAGDGGRLDGGVEPCRLSADIHQDTVLGGAFCDAYLVEVPLAVRDGATLSIAAGTELRFEPGTGITVGSESDGRLEILGSEDKKVLLTSLAPEDDTGGRWAGVVFKSSTLPGSVIRHAVVQNSAGTSGGCITLDNTAPGAVKLEAIRVEGCSSAGFWIDVPSYELTPPVEVADAKFGISLAARNVAGLTVPLALENVAVNEIRGGTISESATWLAQPVPWMVRGNIAVQGETIPVLALEAGLHLRFDQSTWMIIGDDLPGAITIHGSDDAPVIMEASNAGGWHGLVIGAAADVRTSLDHVVLKGGGRRGEDVRGCLTVRGTTPISVTASRFEACEQAGIGASDPLFRFARLEGNTFADSSVGLWLDARAVGSITSAQTFSGVLTNAIDGDEIGRNAVWVGQSVPFTIKDSITVQGAENPILRLQPGVCMRFGPSSWLQIGSAASGGLVALGTDADPVVLESSSPNPGRGAWRGVVFGGNATSGSRLDRVIIRHGGQIELDAKGCLTVRGPSPRPISIVRSVFESCAQAGIAAGGDFEFEALSDNVFRDSDAGLDFAASAVASVQSPQTYDRVPFNRITGNLVTRDGVWSRQDVPWRVRGTVSVEGPNGPLLELDPGLDLLFDDGALITVGLSEPGALRIGGSVTMQSAQNAPGAGDWGGLLLGPQVLQGTQIDGLLLAGAGQPLAGVHGALTLLATDGRVSVTNSQFRTNAQADIYVDCGSQPLLTGNAYSQTGVAFEMGCN